MRIIDADELMEHVWRDKLDSRELIAKMIENAPTVKEIPTKIPLEVFEQLISQKLARMTDANDETDNLVEIGTLEAGTTVEVGGIQMEILDKTLTTKNGNELSVAAFCLAKDILFEKAFDKDNNNNWKKSSLRRYLNGEYKDNLPDELKEALIPFKRNLLTNDGMKDYGSSTDLISLISEREYQDYREYISNKSVWWWTLTARSARSGNLSDVRFVATNGSLGSGNAYFGSCGVSPTFLLRPSLKVKIVKEKKKEG